MLRTRQVDRAVAAKLDRLSWSAPDFGRSLDWHTSRLGQ